MKSEQLQMKVTAQLDTIARKTKKKLKRLSEEFFPNMHSSMLQSDDEVLDNTLNDCMEQRLVDPEFKCSMKQRRRTMCPKLLQESTRSYRLNPDLAASASSDSGFSSIGSSMESLNSIPEESMQSLLSPHESKHQPLQRRSRTIRQKNSRRRSTGYVPLQADDLHQQKRRNSEIWYSAAQAITNKDVGIAEYMDNMDEAANQLVQDGLLMSAPRTRNHETLSPRLPVLELINTDPVTGTKHQLYQTYKGQLNLGIYVNYGLLTVHLKEARHLVSSHTTCNPYIKVSLIPDHARKSGCRSTVMYASMNPVFDEKFSFELGKGDFDKRLLISVWNKSCVADQSVELLGCMSFGIRGILQRTDAGMEGWYYLLSEVIGQSKHLMAVPQDTETLNKEHAPTSKPLAPQFHIKKLYIRKTASGYGFSMRGSALTEVSKVKSGSEAESAGVCVGDQILKVCGEKVGHCSAVAIQQIIKEQSGFITIQVRRQEQQLSWKQN